MKKIAVFIFTIVFALSAISASAKTPDFLYKTYNNYTQTGSMTLTFNSSDDLVKLFEELEMPEEINNYVDLKALLESLLSYSTTMTVQADMSDDYSKAEIAITMDSQYGIDVNKNLNIDVEAKTGMWIKMDLNQEVFEVIYSYPSLNKYMTADLFEMITDEAEKAEMLSFLKSLFNKDYMESMQEFSANLFAKYAKIKLSGSKCTIKIDNDAFIAIFDETMAYVMEFMPDDMKTEFPSLEGLQILGKDGITYTYSLLSGKPSKADVKADISVDISKIYGQLTGGEWEYESKGVLDFAIESNMKMTAYGKTKVEFPELTDENSFSIMDMMPQPVDYDEDYDYAAEIYPFDWADCYTEDLPKIDGEFYVPLRETIGAAYYDMAEVGYNDGVITLASEYFPGFKVLELTVNSNVAYADGVPVEIKRVHEENGVSYVSVSTIEQIFGWELTYASYDLVENIYTYGFYTDN